MKARTNCTHGTYGYAKTIKSRFNYYVTLIYPIPHPLSATNRFIVRQGNISFDFISVVLFSSFPYFLQKKCVSECPMKLPFVMSNSNTCLESCPKDNFASEHNICQSCDQECVGGCTNDTNKGCEKCEHVSLDGACLAKCPDSYEDSGGICRLR